MNIVELQLDETLADFEVQDWIDNVFSKQYPDIKATIKKGCDGKCFEKHTKKIDDFENMKAGLESEIARLKEKIESDKELIHKLRLALIQERVSNICCNGIDAVKMFDDMLKAAKKHL